MKTCTFWKKFFDIINLEMLCILIIIIEHIIKIIIIIIIIIIISVWKFFAEPTLRAYFVRPESGTANKTRIHNSLQKWRMIMICTIVLHQIWIWRHLCFWIINIITPHPNVRSMHHNSLLQEHTYDTRQILFKSMKQKMDL